MKDLEEIEIQPGTYADHRPLYLTIKDYPKRRIWRLNASHLKNNEFRKEIEREMKEFYNLNIQEGTSINTVWDAGKAFFRGITIRFTIRQAKEKSKKFKDLKEKMGREEDKLKFSPNNRQLKDNIKLIQYKINVLLMEEIGKKIAKQKFFEHANKPGKWLAHTVAREKTKIGLLVCWIRRDRSVPPRKKCRK